MRKLFSIFIAALFLLTAAKVDAQKIGVKTGINFSNIGFTGSESDLYSSAIAYRMASTYGGYINMKLVPLVSLQFEGNYDPKGMKFNAPPIANGQFQGDFTYYEHYNYFTMPLLLKVNLIAFHLEAGPYLSLLLSAREVKKGKIQVPNPDGGWIEQFYNEDNDLKLVTNKTDYGIAAGLGTTFNLGPVQLMAGARYNHGLSNLLKSPLTDPNGNVILDQKKNRNFTVYAGVALGL
ncbi:MAG: porin family protein [Bacteroidales bacterium]